MAVWPPEMRNALQTAERTAAFAVAVAVVVVAIAVTRSSHVQAQTGSFSHAETRQLRAGQLVVRREEQQRGGHHMMGGTSFQIIDLPPDVVWRAMRDTPSYRHFLPQVASSRMVEHNGEHRLLHIVHRQGPISADYFVSIDFLPSRRMGQLRVDTSRHGSIREGWGFFSVQPYGSNRTMVTWGIMADVGDGMVAGLVRSRVHDWMLRVPAELKRYVEGWGRSRYDTDG